ncbi:hypothetical protein ACGFZU_35255 [Streptomyces tendae]|uniref:hypothetical protein n=1 Tax=Streptomyces tendae TaxID=1932 RepID=UPI0037132E55
MTESAPSRRTVGLIVGVALVVVGAVLAAFAVFGGSDGNAAPGPTSPPTTSQQPTADPTPTAPPTGGGEPTGNPTSPGEPTPSAPDGSSGGCNIFDPECGGASEGGEG